MNKIIRYAADHAWLMIAMVLCISLLAATQVPKVSFDVSAESMLLDDDPELDFYRKTQRTFGADNVMLVYFEDENLFTAKKLKNIRDVIEKIASTQSVASVESIFSLGDLRSVNGEISNQKYLAEIPESTAAIATVITRALGNPFIKNNLVSSDRAAMAAVVVLEKGVSSPDQQILSVAIDENIKALEPELNKVFQIGHPYVRKAITERIANDMEVILPASLAVLLLALALALRRSSGLFVPLLTAGLSVVWTLGLMGAMGIPLNVMTSIVPALLIIIGSTEDIHLLSEYYAGVTSGKDKKNAIYSMGLKMGGAVGLTFFTSYIGFLSISLNNIELLRQFGLVASTGLFFNFFITVLLVPSLLSAFGRNQSSSKKENQQSFFQRLAELVFVVVRDNKKIVITLVVLVTLLATASSLLLKVNNSSLGYFGNKSDVVYRINTLQSNLSGMETMSIIVDSGIEGTFLKVRYLEEIKKIQDYLAGSGFADISLSFVDYLSFLNVVMMEEDPNDISLPEDDELVKEYMLYVNPEHVESYISADHSRARISIRHKVDSSHELNKVLEKIRGFVAENVDSGLKVHLTGESVLAAKAADYMVGAQVKSLLFMTVVIFIVIAMLFFSLKAGMVAIIPNLIPIILLFGIMGFFDIPLNTATAMTAAIALGICVDDTMHFMVRYHHLAKQGTNDGHILINTVRSEAIPILSTSIALAVGFSVMMVSSFPPIVYFGLLSAIVILLALIATFVLTPVLLSMISLITIWDLLALKLKKEVLNDSPLFKDMSEMQIRRATLLGCVSNYRDGDFIIRQGDQGADVYVLLSGGANISKALSDGSSEILDSLQPGDVFGEVSLVFDQPRTADVVADGEVALLSFDWDAMHRVSRVYPRISSKLFANISAILGKRFGEMSSRSRVHS